MFDGVHVVLHDGLVDGNHCIVSVTHDAVLGVDVHHVFLKPRPSRSFHLGLAPFLLP